MNFLDKVIADVTLDMNPNVVDMTDPAQVRFEALCIIKQWVDIDGFFEFAENHGVLTVEENGTRTCEDFAIQFMSAYNNEVRHTY